MAVSGDDISAAWREMYARRGPLRRGSRRPLRSQDWAMGLPQERSGRLSSFRVIAEQTRQRSRLERVLRPEGMLRHAQLPSPLRPGLHESGLTLSKQADGHPSRLDPTITHDLNDGAAPYSTADSRIAGAQRCLIWIVARPNAPARNRGSLPMKIRTWPSCVVGLIAVENSRTFPISSPTPMISTFAG